MIIFDFFSSTFYLFASYLSVDRFASVLTVQADSRFRSVIVLVGWRSGLNDIFCQQK